MVAIDRTRRLAKIPARTSRLSAGWLVSKPRTDSVGRLRGEGQDRLMDIEGVIGSAFNDLFDRE
jgi:hypothetical protein